MKTAKTLKTYISLLVFGMIAVLLLSAFPQRVKAEPIDPYRPGSITVTINGQDEDGNPSPIQGVNILLYRVADVTEDGRIILLPPYAGSVNSDITDPNQWGQFAAEAAVLAESDGPSGSNSTDDNGSASFSNVTAGIYLMLNENYIEIDGQIYTLHPSLVSVPTRDPQSGQWLYEVTVSPKQTVNKAPYKEPKIYKKILEKNDASDNYKKWGDAADYGIGDAICYRLTGTVPDMSSFSTFYYNIVDDMSGGLMLRPETVTIKKLTPNQTVTMDPDPDYVVESAADLSSLGKLTRLETGYQLSSNSSLSALMVTFADLRKSAEQGDYIIVEYEAVLNSNAAIGLTGNPNAVYLEYTDPDNAGASALSQNRQIPASATGFLKLAAGASADVPSGWSILSDGDWNARVQGDPASGIKRTDKDEVVAYTWTLPIEKKDLMNGVSLADAQFVVFYAEDRSEVPEVQEAAESFHSVMDDSMQLEQMKKWILKWNGQNGAYLYDGKYSDDLNACYVSSGSDGKVTLNGVDQGYFFLVEVQSPTGYNRLDHPVFLHVVPAHKLAAGVPAGSREDASVDGHIYGAKGDQMKAINLYMNENGSYASDANLTAVAAGETVVIDNRPGVSLPETGGIGTLWFYAGGACLMCVAAAFLLLKNKKVRN